MVFVFCIEHKIYFKEFVRKALCQPRFHVPGCGYVCPQGRHDPA